MRKVVQEITSEIYTSIDKLPEADRRVLDMAIHVAPEAYAVYSNFHVGAALELEDGEIICGTNQENVAYPSGTCAERTAFYYAGSRYPEKKILRVAITAFSKNFKVNYPISPCGACRQAMAEYENKQHQAIRVIMMGEEGEIRVMDSVSDLLPFVFNEASLKKD